MKVYKIFLIFIIPTMLCSTTVTLINTAKLEGQIISYEKGNVYIKKDKTLFVAHKDIIRNIEDDNSAISIDKISRQKFRRVDFNDFSQIIEIDQRNIYSYKTYADVYKYYSNINPEKPPFDPPPDPALKRHHYLTIKPLRLIMGKWIDVTYGYRFIKIHSEWRMSFSYMPDFPTILATGLVVSSPSDLYTLSSSFRIYNSPNGMGWFGGIGLGAGVLKADDAKLFFDLIETKEDLQLGFGGILLELGATGMIFNHGITTFSLSAVIGYPAFKTESTEWEFEKKIGIVPSVNYSIGLTF